MTNESQTRLCSELIHHSSERTWICNALLGHPGEHLWKDINTPRHWDFVDENGCLYCICDIGLQ